jgi:hypothetical protein
MSVMEVERAKRGLVITRSGEHDAPPVHIYNSEGELICRVWAWGCHSGRVKVAFDADRSQYPVYRGEIAEAAMAEGRL